VARRKDDAKPFSAPLPLRAIYDDRLAGLDIRVLAAVAAHDRMSLFFDSGQAGCWASQGRLAAEVGCNYINLGKSLKKLGELGYLQRTKRTFADKGKDGPLYVYRVLGHLYAHDESLSFGKRGESANSRGLSETANNDPEVVCHDPAENDAKSIASPSQYISLSDVRYSTEVEENTHLKMRVADATRGLGSEDQEDHVPPLGQSLAVFERQWKADWTQYKGHLPEWRDWLFEKAEFAASEGDAQLAGRARRLGEMVELFGWEHGLIPDDSWTEDDRRNGRPNPMAGADSQ
jgi:hypothetical protein